MAGFITIPNILIKNRSRINRSIYIGDNTRRHSHKITIPPGHEYRWQAEIGVFEINALCVWIVDYAAGIRFDVYHGTSPESYHSMSVDLEDHYVVHHGRRYSHANIRNHRKLC